MTTHSSSASWQTFREGFDQRLLATLIANCEELPLQQESFLQTFFKHIQSLASQGKRIRPYVASLLFEAAGGKSEAQPWQAWIGLELVHVFCLIHDDIIDHGKLRHAVETFHTFMERRLQEEERHGNAEQTGKSQALLAGDLVYTWAFESFFEAVETAKDPSSVKKLFFQLLKEVIAGQALDVDLTTREAQPYALIEQKMLLKTARYTFSRPMQIGASFGPNATSELLRFCQEFGEPLGMAFQLQDDWFDLIAGEQRTGKTGCRDLEEGQQTFFTCYVAEHGTIAQQEQLSRLLGHPLNKQEQEEAYTLLDDMRALKNGEVLIQTYFQEAQRALDRATFLPEKSRTSLGELLTLLSSRSA